MARENGSRRLANNKTVFLREDYYEIIGYLAQKGRRAKTEQLRIIIDFYLDSHPGILTDKGE